MQNRYDSWDVANKEPSNRPDYVELSALESPRQSMDDGSPTTYTANASRHAETEAIDGGEDMPLWQAIRTYPKIVFYCLGMTTAILAWGYGLVVTGQVTLLDRFLKDYGSDVLIDGELQMDSIWLSLWAALPPTGAVLGALLGGWLQDRFGRRSTLMTGTTILVISVVVTFFSYLPGTKIVRQSVITAGFTVQGFGVSITKTTALTYVSENAPKALRGPAMGLFPTFTLLGQLLGLVVLYLNSDVEEQSGYLTAFGSMAVPAVAAFILGCIMPESPAFLIRKGEDPKALRASRRLYAPKADAVKELSIIRAAVESEQAEKSSVSYVACFKGVDLRRTMIVIFANLIQAMFGLDLLSTSAFFLKTLGLESSYGLLFMMAGIVVGMLANGAGIWILTRAGRRNITMVSLGIAGILWGSMGVSGFFHTTAGAWIAGGIMIAILAVCGMGCWPSSYAIMGEASSLKLRAATQGVGNVAGQGSSILMGGILPFLFNTDAGNLGAKTGFVYCGLCAIATVITWLYLPEMKGRSMAELNHMFALKMPARKFKDFQMEADEALSSAQGDTPYPVQSNINISFLAMPASTLAGTP
ncbi:sugar transporter-domain-containing protein [Xylariomycetidae sp. FL2044]|nr:sugar transporter-domain-containing protein [Xylariomycetidae sp. FL2044]